MGSTGRQYSKTNLVVNLTCFCLAFSSCMFSESLSKSLDGERFAFSLFDPSIAEAVKSAWQAHGKNELLLMSFHGLTELLTKLGDPYYHQCHATVKLITEKLGLDDNQWLLVFQSRFGKAEWLKPYCADTLQKPPGQGTKTIDVICPDFAADCLETLEEMAMENKAVFMEAGGTD